MLRVASARFDPTGGISAGGCEGRDHVFPMLDTDEPRFLEGRRALETARRRRGLACQPFSRRPAATAPPRPDRRRRRRPIGDGRVARHASRERPRGQRDTRVRRSSLPRGRRRDVGGGRRRRGNRQGGEKAESDADSDSDREILPFDHDYDTEAEMEGRRQRWGGADKYACPPRPGNEKPPERTPAERTSGETDDEGERVDASDANKVGRLRFLPPRLGPLLLRRRLRRGRIETQIVGKSVGQSASRTKVQARDARSRAARDQRGRTSDVASKREAERY